jgi:hypothetical protein
LALLEMQAAKAAHAEQMDMEMSTSSCDRPALCEPR